MKFIPIHFNSVILGFELFKKKSEEESNFIGIKWDAESAARQLIQAIEEDCCVAFLEAISLQAQKAINRHADFCFNNAEWEDKELPEWATKYKEAGL